MIKRLLLLLIILLIPLGGYLWYRQTPKQLIERTVDQFIKNVEHQKISSRRQIDVHQALKEVLAPKFKLNIHGDLPIPIPLGEMTPEEVLSKVDFFHQISHHCEMVEIERSIQLIGNKAQVHQTSNITVAIGIGQGSQTEETWELVFDLEKNEDWQITSVRGRRR